MENGVRGVNSFRGPSDSCGQRLADSRAHILRKDDSSTHRGAGNRPGRLCGTALSEISCRLRGCRLSQVGLSLWSRTSSELPTSRSQELGPAKGICQASVQGIRTPVLNCSPFIPPHHPLPPPRPTHTHRSTIPGQKTPQRSYDGHGFRRCTST